MVSSEHNLVIQTPIEPQILKEVLEYGADHREIVHVDGNTNNLFTCNLVIPLDPKSIRTRLIRRWKVNTIIRLAHEMYRVTYDECQDDCTHCFPQQHFMSHIDRLISETRFQYGEIKSRCHNKCGGHCWQMSSAGCYGKTEINEHVSQRIADLDYIRSQLLVFLAPDLMIQDKLLTGTI
jgi:hypothetical protein